MFYPNRFIFKKQPERPAQGVDSADTPESSDTPTPYTPVTPDKRAEKEEREGSDQVCEDLETRLDYEKALQGNLESNFNVLFTAYEQQIAEYGDLLGQGEEIRETLRSQLDAWLESQDVCDRPLNELMQEMDSYIITLHAYVAVWARLEKNRGFGTMRVQPGTTYGNLEQFIQNCPLGLGLTMLLEPRPAIAGGRDTTMDQNDTQWEDNEMKKADYLSERFTEIASTYDLPGIARWEAETRKSLVNRLVMEVIGHASFDSVTASDTLRILRDFTNQLSVYERTDEYSEDGIIDYIIERNLDSK